MKRKKIIIALVNLMAFGAIFATVYLKVGVKLSLQLLIPSSIIFGTNIAVLLSYGGERE